MTAPPAALQGRTVLKKEAAGVVVPADTPIEVLFNIEGDEVEMDERVAGILYFFTKQSLKVLAAGSM